MSTIKCAAVFLDIEKAFDTTWQLTLLNKVITGAWTYRLGESQISENKIGP
jgi:hypothetical protein